MIFVKIVQKIQKSFHDFTFNFSKLEFFYDFGSNLKFVQFLMFCLDFFRCFLVHKFLIHKFLKIGS
jgi:hypothetical protein